uniref:DUF659 domain-containing protein n=1 Tax=Lactuca sativa TaxID=4236 RepID=A0A9R1WI17_LACSA|nr:hypothetical protein LSAT_V11C200054050 [Lactuca sativa]
MEEYPHKAHTSQNIYEYVDSYIQKVGHEHVVQVVTDDATNNMGRQSIEAFPRFKKILDQAKKLTIFIYAHQKTLEMMRSYTNKTEIMRPRVTRFSSAFLTLQRLSKKKDQLRHMFSSTEWEECKFYDTPKGFARYK